MKIHESFQKANTFFPFTLYEIQPYMSASRMAFETVNSPKNIKIPFNFISDSGSGECVRIYLKKKTHLTEKIQNCTVESI